MLRTLAASLLLAVPAFAQAPIERAFAPEPGFVLQSTQGAYTCNPATVGPNGRCASTEGPKSQWDPLGWLRPQLLVITFDDCITPGSEKYVRSVFDGTVRNPDGRPVPLTYFVSMDNCPATGDGVWHTDGNLVKDRYNAGHEMAVHTRSHQTGAGTPYATWVREMTEVRTYFKGLGLGDDAGRGFRAPYLASNGDMFRALKDLGFLYDSSVLESPFWSPVSNGTGRYVWPFTYDQYSPSAQPQNCENWSASNGCPTQAIPGLWQIPLYTYAQGSPTNATYLGAMDVGHPEYSGYEKPLTGPALLSALRSHRDARLSGNRAPMTLFMHASGLSDPARAATYKAFLKETLRRGDVWAVTSQGLVEWMKQPNTFLEMWSWYGQYCRRHTCSAPFSAGDALADTPTLEAATPATTVLSVYPNPAREQATATVTTVTANARLVVLDVLGREVFSETLGAEGPHRVALDLAGQSAGMYLVRVTETGGRVQQQRLVVR